MYSAIKNEILPFAIVWIVGIIMAPMVPNGIILSEISQIEKDKYCMISLVCGIENMNNNCSYKKEIRFVVTKS